MKTLSIVIPVYNSENTIGHLCTTLIGLYSGRYRLELLLVNDGSRDSSDVICRGLYEAHPDVISYIRLSKNFGEHNAVIAGLNHASGDYCVIMDDDFQNPPAEVGKLVEEVEKGYDVVYASYSSKKDSLFRNLGSRLNDWMATVVLRKPGNLYLSSFKVMNRFLVREIIKYTGPDPYIDAIILRATDNIGTVRLEHRPRTYSESGYTFRKLIALWGNMVVSFSVVPLRIIGIAGVLMAFFGLGYGIFKAFDDWGVATKLSDFETLMSMNMIFRGAELLAISLLGEYIGRIYLSLNKDPQFVVRERFSARLKQDQVAYLDAYKAKDGPKDHSRRD